MRLDLGIVLEPKYLPDYVKARSGQNVVEVSSLLYHTSPVVRAAACTNLGLKESDIECAVADANHIVVANLLRRCTRNAVIRFIKMRLKNEDAFPEQARKDPIWSVEADRKQLDAAIKARRLLRKKKE